MELPITKKDLDTIVRALALGGDTRLYFLLKEIKEQHQMRTKSDEYIEQGTCDI